MLERMHQIAPPLRGFVETRIDPMNKMRPRSRRVGPIVDLSAGRHVRPAFIRERLNPLQFTLSRSRKRLERALLLLRGKEPVARPGQRQNCNAIDDVACRKTGWFGFLSRPLRGNILWLFGWCLLRFLLDLAMCTSRPNHYRPLVAAMPSRLGP